MQRYKVQFNIELNIVNHEYVNLDQQRADMIIDLVRSAAKDLHAKMLLTAEPQENITVNATFTVLGANDLPLHPAHPIRGINDTDPTPDP